MKKKQLRNSETEIEENDRNCNYGVVYNNIVQKPEIEDLAKKTGF